MKRPLIVANWKAYVESGDVASSSAKAVLKGVSKYPADVVLCPALPHLAPVSKILSKKGVMLGAQVVSAFPGGAHTGEVSAKMLKGTGVSYVIVGHSERRASGETNESVHAQLEAVLLEKMTAIVCVGELERDPAGGHFSHIETQLRTALASLSPKEVKRVIVAYEPVWAIGKTAADAIVPSELEEIVIYIRKILAEIIGREPALALPILYGGSVEIANAAELAGTGISGFLIGHASVEPASLLSIVKTVTNHATQIRRRR